MDSKFISGYDGKYTIFSNGIVQRNASKFRKKTMILKPKKDNYLRVSLHNNEGYKIFSIHRLVAIYFLPNEENKECVNHKDGNKFNNNVENLEWCSPLENLMHSINVLKRNRNTEKQRQSASLQGKSKRKLTIEQAKNIRESSKEKTRKYLASKYKVSLSVIDNILNNKRYVD